LCKKFISSITSPTTRDEPPDKDQVWFFLGSTYLSNFLSTYTLNHSQ